MKTARVKTALTILCVVIVVGFIVLMLMDWTPDCKKEMPWMAEVCRK